MVDLATFGKALGFVAPWYNLAFVIVVIALFIWLFSLKNRKVYEKPWVFVFVGVLIFVVEETMTVLRSLGLVSFPGFIFPIFEMGMLGLFIYAMLLQKQYVKTGKRG